MFALLNILGFHSEVLSSFLSCTCPPGTTLYVSLYLPLPLTSAFLSVLENMSGQGSTIGGQFSELKGIIDRVHDQSRVGVCLDTCHAFAAGEGALIEEFK